MRTLERQTFETQRAAEYFTPKELQAQTGQPVNRFADVLFKELIDNALDASESLGVAPVVTLETAVDGECATITVLDNGAGIPPETVTRILNFSTRTSDKAAYRSPSRGLQGNAAKTVIGIPAALGVDVPIVIDAQNVRHILHAWATPAGDVRTEHDVQEVEETCGTRITVSLPLDGLEWRPDHWARAFSLFNPHVSVQIRQSGSGIERC